MTQPVILREKALSQHFDRISTIARKATGRRELQFADERAGHRVIAGLRGSTCEKAHSPKRGTRWVAPIVPIEDQLQAWLELEEIWEDRPTDPTANEFSFHSLGIGVYFGKRHSTDKVRMFRTEWVQPHDALIPGRFPASHHAAQPHWHFDAPANHDLSRIHFPSAAPWWKAPRESLHVHAPRNIRDIERWAEKSLDYVRAELRARTRRRSRRIS